MFIKGHYLFTFLIDSLLSEIVVSLYLRLYIAQLITYLQYPKL